MKSNKKTKDHKSMFTPKQKRVMEMSFMPDYTMSSIRMPSLILQQKSICRFLRYSKK